ncbi:hypothetical protein SAMN04489812_2922 [Microlunatus soli]|uniref:Uncharacterized protein n=2 Tax=Microlunatus soli TaxID=630515 RepID=A0A1H1UT11_9ACTN|nr:hypothetical protein SAMN04489812_2922 [Microlunatus soli]
MLQQLRAALAAAGTVEPYGSAVDDDLLDSWSDLDAAVELTEPVAFDHLGLGAAWAWQDSRTSDHQTLRTVLPDGRRLDLSVRGDAIAMPQPGPDNPVRFEAALAAARIGRGDRLIGLHLTMGILRECLVIAMLLRDRAEGTDRHRFGSDLDHRADDVARIAALPTDPRQRPTIVEQACRLYGDWRAELHPGYRPDWSGLTAVIDRGTAIR